MLATLPLGAAVLDEGTRFRAFSTTAQRCQVRFFDQGGQALRTYPLEPLGDGFFQATIAGVGPGALYKLVLDDRELPDPYARFLPQGVHGPALVVQARHQFRHGPGVHRPLGQHIIYELHVGTFSRAGTYAGVRERLPQLADLGITAIQLLPLAAFAGSRGWGYDGVAPFAPFAGYGTPDDLRALIDDAHGLGLSVFLDVVYNHFGPAGNYLGAYSPDYFTKDFQNGWGDSPNFAHPVMRQLVLDNARYWLGEFRFDGLRLDATHAISDRLPRHVLAELADLARGFQPRRLLIAEDERNEPALVQQLGLDAIWADDFHHQVRVTLTGERDGYYACYQPGARALAETIRGGWLYQGQTYPLSGKPRGKPAQALPAEAFVYCIQNHDQVGNRALGDRLHHQVPLPAYQAASCLLMFLPMTPLLFMGQEWATSSPFLFFTDHEAQLGKAVSEGRRAEFQTFQSFSDPQARAAIPDPQDEATFLRSQLDWDEFSRPGHAETLALYRQLIALRRSDPVLSSSARDGLEVSVPPGPDGGEQDQLLVVRRWNDKGSRRLFLNLSPQPVTLPPGLGLEHAITLVATPGQPQADARQLAGYGALLLADPPPMTPAPLPDVAFP